MPISNSTNPDRVSDPTLTRQAAVEYIRDHVFKLRPKNYLRDYPRWPGLIGLEIEMLPIVTASLDTERPVVTQLHGPQSLSVLIDELSRAQGWIPQYLSGSGPDAERVLNVEIPHEGLISFEPGGQLEISTLPFPCLVDANASLERIQRVLDGFMSVRGVTVMQHGINPWQTVDEIGLQMSKPRYQAMDQYFNEISPFGRRMMRQTCTMQVNLDFGGDEKTLAQRFVAANLMAPFATALFANSPVVNRQATGLKSCRAEAWRYIDPARSGCANVKRVAETWSRDLCAADYAERVLEAPVIFIEGLDYARPQPNLKFQDWIARPYQGLSPTLKDLHTHLSLYFPEVRARGFLELRSLDCPSRVWQAVPGLFYTALLYADHSVEQILGRLLPLADQLPELLLRAGELGMADTQLGEHGQWLMDLACQAAAKLPSCFHNQNGLNVLKAYQQHFSDRRRSPSDDIIDALGGDAGAFLPRLYLQLESQWRQLL